MRYYDLDTNGKVKGSYAVPQPGMILHLIEDAPDNESKRDGVPGSAWAPDTDAIRAALKARLKRELEQTASRDAALFRMILAMWDIGVTKGLWVNTELPVAIRTMVAEWKQKLQEIDS